jgi:sigma-B regulation protein RsbU (phosphoserine phosphatase)
VSTPESIVTAINQALAEGNESNMFVTLFVGVLNLTTGHFSYCNAGHNPPLVIDKNGCQKLPCDANIPGGVMSNWTFSKQEMMLEPQTTIFLYTDGLTEAEDMFHDQFQMEQVNKVIEDLQTAQVTQSEAIIGKMAEAVHFFVGGAEQSDDLTMLAIRYLP